MASARVQPRIHFNHVSVHFVILLITGIQSVLSRQQPSTTSAVRVLLQSTTDTSICGNQATGFPQSKNRINEMISATSVGIKVITTLALPLSGNVGGAMTAVETLQTSLSLKNGLATLQTYIQPENTANSFDCLSDYVNKVISKNNNNLATALTNVKLNQIYEALSTFNNALANNVTSDMQDCMDSLTKPGGYLKEALSLYKQLIKVSNVPELLPGLAAFIGTELLPIFRSKVTGFDIIYGSKNDMKSWPSAWQKDSQGSFQGLGSWAYYYNEAVNDLISLTNQSIKLSNEAKPLYIKKKFNSDLKFRTDSNNAYSDLTGYYASSPSLPTGLEGSEQGWTAGCLKGSDGIYAGIYCGVKYAPGDVTSADNYHTYTYSNSQISNLVSDAQIGSTLMRSIQDRVNKTLKLTTAVSTVHQPVWDLIGGKVTSAKLVNNKYYSHTTKGCWFPSLSFIPYIKDASFTRNGMAFSESGNGNISTMTLDRGTDFGSTKLKSIEYTTYYTKANPCSFCHYAEISILSGVKLVYSTPSGDLITEIKARVPPPPRKNLNIKSMDWTATTKKIAITKDNPVVKMDWVTYTWSGRSNAKSGMGAIRGVTLWFKDGTSQDMGYFDTNTLNENNLNGIAGTKFEDDFSGWGGKVWLCGMEGWSVDFSPLGLNDGPVLFDSSVTNGQVLPIVGGLAPVWCHNKAVVNA